MKALARTARVALAVALLASPAAAIVCSPGFYDDGGVCVPCDPGQYQSVSGATTCVDCPLGKYQDQAGQSECLNCAPGSFNDLPGAESCPLCPLGKYQAAAGGTTCFDCLAGFVAPVTGSVSCEACAIGTAQPLDGQATCDSCLAGTYQPAAGATTCLDCDAGTFQDQDGQAECFECPGGAAMPCSDNGICADGAGDGTCTCDPGYIGAACSIAGSEAGVSAKKLIVIDKLVAASKAKVVYVSKDTDAGITKGAGTDVATVSASFTFGYDGSVGEFTMPQGANWVVNKSTVAKYVNKSAPGGAGGVKVTVVKPGKLIKVVGASLGDVPIDLFAAGPPDEDIETVYTITNDGEVNRFCTTFEAATAIFKEIAGGTGRKLVAKGGSAAECVEGSPSGAFVD